MAREGLVLPLRDALHECRQGNAPVRRSRVQIRGEGAIRETDLLVLRVKLPDTDERCCLVLFEAPRHEPAAASGSSAGATGPSTPARWLAAPPLRRRDELRRCRGARATRGARSQRAAAGTRRDARLPPVGHRATRRCERGAEIGQRGAPFQQRGTAEHQRGVGDRQGRAPVRQRRVGDGQRAAHQPEPAMDQAQRRHDQPARQRERADDGRGRRSPHPLVHAGGR